MVNHHLKEPMSMCPMASMCRGISEKPPVTGAYDDAGRGPYHNWDRCSAGAKSSGLAGSHCDDNHGRLSSDGWRLDTPDDRTTSRRSRVARAGGIGEVRGGIGGVTLPVCRCAC